MTLRLEIAGLSCARGDQPLFSDLGLQVAGGELLHVVGSNGSGKTTLLRTLCGLSRPAAGEIRWQGKSIQTLGDEYRQYLAYVGHLDGVQGELTPTENLRTLVCSAGTKETRATGLGQAERRIDDALERMGLSALRAFPAKVFSQGQKRRLALARLLVLRRPLWVLDEPFTALDAPSCALVNETLAEHLAQDGVAVLSSHQRLEVPSAALKRVDLDFPRNARGEKTGDGAGPRSFAGRYTA